MMKKAIPAFVFFAIVLTGWDGLTALAINFGSTFEDTPFGQNAVAIVNQFGEMPASVKNLVCHFKHSDVAQSRACAHESTHRFLRMLAESKKFYGVPAAVIPLAYAGEDDIASSDTVTSRSLLRMQ